MLKDQTTQPTLFQEDSHANHSALQEKEKEQMTIDTYGMKLLESSENVNLDGLLGKMLKGLLTSTTAWYSDRCKLIWKKKVSKSNVLLFQLQASVLGIKEKEFGLSDVMYPTPTSQDHSRNTVPPSIGKTRGMDLSMRVVADQIKMYPTPNTQDYKTNPGEDLENWKKRAKEKKKKGINLHFALRQAVQMYPTPTQDSASERTKKYKQGGTPLPLAVKMLYLEKKKILTTPTVNDSKNLTFPPSQQKRVGSLIKDVMDHQKIKPGGKLNPNFVEFLMGYPMNWTKIEPTE